VDSERILAFDVRLSDAWRIKFTESD